MQVTTVISHCWLIVKKGTYLVLYCTAQVQYYYFVLPHACHTELCGRTQHLGISTPHISSSRAMEDY